MKIPDWIETTNAESNFVIANTPSLDFHGKELT